MKLKDKFRLHAKYWDCYNDEPLEEDHAQRCVEIAIKLAKEAYERGYEDGIVGEYDPTVYQDEV